MAILHAEKDRHAVLRLLRALRHRNDEVTAVEFRAPAEDKLLEVILRERQRVFVFICVAAVFQLGEAEDDGEPPDLEGLSCRWTPLKATRGRTMF